MAQSRDVRGPDVIVGPADDVQWTLDKGRMLDAVMTYVPEGITIADAPDVMVRMVSDYGRRMTGRGEIEILGGSYEAHPDQWGIFRPDGTTRAKGEDLPLTRAVREGEVVQNEEWILERPDGSCITVLCNAGPIRDDEGRITGGIIAWRDISDLKRALDETAGVREEVRVRNELLTAVYESAPFFVAITSGPDHVIRMANQSYLELVGGRKVVGLPVVEAFPEAGDQGLLDILDRVYATGEPFIGRQMEVSIARPTGKGAQRRVLNFVYHPIRDTAGDVTGIHVHGTDETERVEALRTAREQEARFRSVLEDALDAAYRRNVQTDTYEYVSPVIERITGYTQDEFTRLPMAELSLRIHPDDRGLVEAGIEASSRVGHGALEYRFLRKDGTYCWLADHYTVHLDDLGQPLHRSGIVRDTTQRKETEDALRMSEERFRASVENLLDPFGIYSSIRDEKGGIVDFRVDYVNAAACEVNRMTRSAQLGRGVLELFPGHIESGLFHRLTRLVESGEPVEEERVHFIDESDPERPEYVMDVRAARLGDGFVASWRDVTARVQNEETLRRRDQELQRLNQTLERRIAERTEDLEERNQELQNLAYVASHDLREPIRKIRTFGTLLQEEVGDQLSGDAQMFVERMRSAATRMDGLLNDLLEFSRVATHVQSFKTVNLDQVAESVLAQHQALIDEADAHVEVEAGVTVTGDARQLQQLIGHLLENAIKFRRQEVSPSVRIRAAIEEGIFTDGPVRVCRITVVDNGIGFDEKYVDRIFEPFQRLHARDAYEGSGIGLAVCRRIVQRHRGSIIARSEPGRGSTFIVNMPLGATD